MTTKQILYKKNRLAGMDKYNSARKAGYSHYTSRRIYKDNEKIDKEISDKFLKAGLTDEKMIEHALAGLEAEREIIIDGTKYGDSPDWQIRHKYFTSILQLTKKLNADTKPNGGDTKIIVVYPPGYQTQKETPIKHEVVSANRTEAISS